MMNSDDRDMTPDEYVAWLEDRSEYGTDAHLRAAWDFHATTSDLPR